MDGWMDGRGGAPESSPNPPFQNKIPPQHRSKRVQVVSFLPEPELAREIFRVYLGEPPVSQEAKDHLASEVPALLKEGK